MKSLSSISRLCTMPNMRWSMNISLWKMRISRSTMSWVRSWRGLGWGLSLRRWQGLLRGWGKREDRIGISRLRITWFNGSNKKSLQRVNSTTPKRTSTKYTSPSSAPINPNPSPPPTTSACSKNINSWTSPLPTATESKNQSRTFSTKRISPNSYAKRRKILRTMCSEMSMKKMSQTWTPLRNWRKSLRSSMTGRRIPKI